MMRDTGLKEDQKLWKVPSFNAWVSLMVGEWRISPDFFFKISKTPTARCSIEKLVLFLISFLEKKRSFF